jgi:lipoate-protein ligase B
MGSIGIAIRKGISFHGLALNVNVDLTPFSWIQPCGLQGVCMTSMRQELDSELSMKEVRTAVKKQFESILHVNLTAANISDLMPQLRNQKSKNC